MDFNLLTAAVIGLITGALGSIGAPWINWFIEKRRIRLDKKIKIFDSVRDYISKNEFEKEEFRNTVIFSKVRPYFNTELIESIEYDGDNYIDDTGMQHITIEIGAIRYNRTKILKFRILDELSILEKAM